MLRCLKEEWRVLNKHEAGKDGGRGGEEPSSSQVTSHLDWGRLTGTDCQYLFFFLPQYVLVVGVPVLLIKTAKLAPDDRFRWW